MLPHWLVILIIVIVCWFAFWRIVLPALLVLLAGLIAVFVGLWSLFPHGEYTK